VVYWGRAVSLAGAPSTHSLRKLQSLRRAIACVWLAFARTCSDYRLALTAFGCLSYSHSLACPRTIVLRYTSCGCVYRAAQGSRTHGRYRSLLLAVARLCSDYRPALAAVRLLVYGSRKPDSANVSIAPTITNASVSAQATAPSEDSLYKGE